MARTGKAVRQEDTDFAALRSRVHGLDYRLQRQAFWRSLMSRNQLKFAEGWFAASGIQEC